MRSHDSILGKKYTVELQYLPIQMGGFCHKRKIDPYNCKFDNGIEFLSHLFQNGEKYGYIAAARSALSAVLQKEEDKTFGKDPRVTKFLK